MTLDPRTVIIINIISSALYGIALLAVSRSYLRQITSIRLWAVASLVHALGWVLTALRDYIPDFISIIMGQTALLFSLAFYYHIIVLFTGKARSTSKVYYIVAACILALAYYLWVIPDVAIRIALVSATCAYLLLNSASVLVFGSQRKTSSAWFTATVFIFSGAIFLFRTVYALVWDTNPTQTIFAQNAIQEVTFLTAYLTAAMLTFGFLLMSYDRYINQHEAIEEKLLLSEMSLIEAQRLAKIGSWEFNLDTGDLTWSKEQYRIFEMEEAAPDVLYELCRKKIHPDDLTPMDEAIRIAREKGEGVVYEHRVLLSDGRVKHLVGIGDAYKSVDGSKNMLRGTVQDITEQKKAEETAKKYAILAAKSKEMEQFTYIASHDLREPLLTIKNYAELFAEENNDSLNGEAKEYLLRISRASKRMDELIHGLLDYSRLSKVKELQKVNTNILLQEVLADINSLIITNNAKIIVGELPVINAYPLELKQLFQNLLTNAIKFRNKERNPEISISAKEIKGIWTFEITDNGIGVPVEEREKIFGLFQRAHSKSEYAGSGIGLAICQKIAELHHGNIWVDVDITVGSKFCFTIVT